MPSSNSSTIAPASASAAAGVAACCAPPRGRAGSRPGAGRRRSAAPRCPRARSGISSLGRSDTMSEGCGPASTFSNSAESATVRASGPQWQYWSRLNGGSTGTRPNGGLKPTTPLNDAGMRIEPPMSEPLASSDVPGRERGARAARRAADAELGVPRVAGHAPQPRVGEPGARELGRGGARVDDAARLDDPLGDRGGGRGRCRPCASATPATTARRRSTPRP